MLKMGNLSLRSRLILIFLAVILFTSLCISWFSYKASEKAIRSQAEALIKGYLDQTSGRFELFMDNIHRTTMSVTFSKELNKFLLNTGGDNYENYYDLLRITDLMSTYNNSNRYIYLMVIYDFKNNTVIPSRGSKSVVTDDSAEYAFVKSVFVGNSQAKTIQYRWVGARSVNLHGLDKRVFTFLMPAKSNVSTEIIGCIATYILEDQLLSMCSSMAANSEGAVILLDGNSQVMSAAGNDFDDATLWKLIDRYNPASSTYSREVDGTRYLVTTKKSEYDGWSFASVVSLNRLMLKSAGVLRNTFLIICIVTILVALLLSFVINLFFYKPIRYLINDIKVHGTEGMDRKLATRNDEIGFIFRNFNEILNENKALVRNVYEQKIHLRESEIRLLHSQINPHFLYNSLDSIIWLLVFEEYDKIKSMVKAIVRFFRISLDKGNEIIPVRLVKEQIESYFVIQQIRYADRLRVEIAFEEAILQEKMLKLLLQPIIENSIYHGVEKKSDEGFVRVTGTRLDSELLFIVEDNGGGITAERLEEVNRIINTEEEDAESFYALKNINRRIKLFYGENYGIMIRNNQTGGLTVSVRIPVIDELG